jgi:hypothetical protein
VIGSGSLQNPTLPRKLWDDAYDSLENTEKELVKHYRMVLAKVLVDKKLQDLEPEEAINVSATRTFKAEAKPLQKKIIGRINDPNAPETTHASIAGVSNVLTRRESLEAEILDELKDQTKRQMHMETLVENGKNKFANSSKITTAVNRFSKAVLSLKPVVDPLIENIPHAAPAALPWAGVCFGLQVSNISFVN